MLKIKIKKTDGEIIKQMKGTLEGIANYCFRNNEVVSIEILEGGVFENEYYKQIPLKIFRASKEEIEEFQLYNNIRISYKVEYKYGQSKERIVSCGLCKVVCS